MIRVTWLLAWQDRTWSLFMEDYAEHDLEDLSEVEICVAKKYAEQEGKEVALIGIYTTEDLDEE